MLANKGKKRLQFDFKPEAFNCLEKLKIRSGAATKAEVIRRALTLYDQAIIHTLEGGKIIFKRQDEENIILIF